MVWLCAKLAPRSSEDMALIATSVAGQGASNLVDGFLEEELRAPELQAATPQDGTAKKAKKAKKPEAEGVKEVVGTSKDNAQQYMKDLIRMVGAAHSMEVALKGVEFTSELQTRLHGLASEMSGLASQLRALTEEQPLADYEVVFGLVEAVAVQFKKCQQNHNERLRPTGKGNSKVRP